MSGSVLRAWTRDPERSVGRQLERQARALGVSRVAVRAVRERLRAAGVDPHEDAGPYLFAIRAGLLREQRLREDLERVGSYLQSLNRRLAGGEARTQGEQRILERLRDGLVERRVLLRSLLVAPLAERDESDRTDGAMLDCTRVGCVPPRQPPGADAHPSR